MTNIIHAGCLVSQCSV